MVIAVGLDNKVFNARNVKHSLVLTMCFYFGTDIEHFAIVYLQFSGYLTLTLTGGKKLHLGMSIFTTHTYSRV